MVHFQYLYYKRWYALRKINPIVNIFFVILLLSILNKIGGILVVSKFERQVNDNLNESFFNQLNGNATKQYQPLLTYSSTLYIRDNYCDYFTFTS